MDDDARWAAAEARLVTGLTPAEREEARRRRLRRLGPQFAVATLVGVTVGVLAVSLSEGHGSDADIAGWRAVTELVLNGLGLLVIVVGLVRAWRLGVWRALRGDDPASVLTPDQQRLLLAQVRGRAPADPRHLGLARDLARRLVVAGYVVPLWVGIGLQQLGRLVGAADTLDLLFAGPAALAMAAAAAAFGWQARRVRRFLDAHPETPGV